MINSISIRITDYSVLFGREQRFKTSLSVIREVMNVPMCALDSILRANGYDKVNPGCICIDEEMLSVFADAYIRKMKNYFLCSVRNIENLTYEEFTDLNEFYNTFKKQKVKFVRRAEWSQIDTDLLRDAFIDKIKKLTPQKKKLIDVLLFGQIVTLADNLEFEYSPILKREITLPDNKRNEDVLIRVSKSLLYHTKRKVHKSFCHVCNFLRQFFVAARYHIFVADDADASHSFQNHIKLTLVFNNLKSNNYEIPKYYQKC